MNHKSTSHRSTKFILDQLAHRFRHASPSEDNIANTQSFTSCLDSNSEELQPCPTTICQPKLQQKQVKYKGPYHKYSDKLKKEIVFDIDRSIQKGSSYYQVIGYLSDLHSISRKNIQRWYRKDKQDKKCRVRGKKVKFALMETKLVEYIMCAHSAISRKNILEKARQIIRQCYGEEQSSNFRGSNRWYYKFINRHSQLRSLHLNNHRFAKEQALGIYDD